MRRMDTVAAAVDRPRKLARSAGRSRAFTSTTVVRVEARSAMATDGGDLERGLADRAAGRRKRRRIVAGQGQPTELTSRCAAGDRSRATAPVEHEQIVERHSVARRVDPRVDDVRAGGASPAQIR